MQLVDLALRVGFAVGSEYPHVIVGRDTRTSGSVLKQAISAGVLCAGASCSDAGVVPTPTLAYATRNFAAGLMVTASHNPPQYNGIKLLNPDGSAFASSQQQRIEQLLHEDYAREIWWDKIQEEEIYEKAVEQHIARIQADFPGVSKLKVVVDAGCGATYDISPRLLSRFGCEVIALNCRPDGIFPHDIEPVESNLGDLMRVVRDSGADLGIAHDGDGDRMMAVDDRGRFIPGDKLMVILARAANYQAIITTVDASMVLDQLSFNVVRTKVGDPNVSEELKNQGEFGGEPSGSWIFPQISLCPDGLYASALLVNIAAHCRLSDLVDSIPSYPVKRGSVVGNILDLETLRSKLISVLEPRSYETIDGIKLIFQDGWLLIRASGTESKIRITVETQTQARLNQLYDGCVAIVRENLAEGDA